MLLVNKVLVARLEVAKRKNIQVIAFFRVTSMTLLLVTYLASFFCYILYNQRSIRKESAGLSLCTAFPFIPVCTGAVKKVFD